MPGLWFQDVGQAHESSLAFNLVIFRVVLVLTCVSRREPPCLTLYACFTCVSMSHLRLFVVVFMFPLLPPPKFILGVLSDDAIETYGRDDLYDVFRAIKEFSQIKACK